MSNFDHMKAKYAENYANMRTAQPESDMRSALERSKPFPCPTPVSGPAAIPEMSATMKAMSAATERARYEYNHPQPRPSDPTDLAVTGLIAAKMAGATDMSWWDVFKTWLLLKIIIPGTIAICLLLAAGIFLFVAWLNGAH